MLTVPLVELIGLKTKLRREQTMTQLRREQTMTQLRDTLVVDLILIEQ